MMYSIEYLVQWRIQDFPLGGGGGPDAIGGGGHQPPMRALFSRNVCENERIGSRCWGYGGGDVPRGSTNAG